VKTQSKEKLALCVARDDAGYILEPVVDGVMAQGLEGKPWTPWLHLSRKK
jgi:hypothetical protein